jgi:YD repeat-containing protein
LIEYPVLLTGEPVHLLAYPIESSIAEKLQAMVTLGDANSRMKDFYDVWICSKHLDFNDGTLFKAVDATFKNRKTTIPIGEVRAFTTAFAERHRVQWNAFAKKVGEDDLVDAFERIAEDIRIFAMPVFVWLARGHSTAQNWKAGRGWVAEVT